MNRHHPAHSITDRLAALSEPIRLRTLRLLEREELSVGEMARIVQLPQSTVSRHLKILSDGGWLHKRTEGTATLYRLVLDDLAADARALWLAVREGLLSGGMSGGVPRGGETTDLIEDSHRLAAILAERRSDCQTFFGRVAGQWDDLRTDLFGQRFTLQALLSFLPRHWTVADLGCGTGNATELLAPVVDRVIAIDQSPPMLKAARKRLAGESDAPETDGASGEKGGNVTFQRGDLESLPLDDASVDATVCILVLHHVENPALACAQMHRILKPGGVALIVDMVQHDRTTYKHTMGHRWLGFSEADMTAHLTAAGFRHPRFLILPSDPDGKGPALFACTAHKPSASPAAQ